MVASGVMSLPAGRPSGLNHIVDIPIACALADSLHDLFYARTFRNKSVVKVKYQCPNCHGLNLAESPGRDKGHAQFLL